MRYLCLVGFAIASSAACVKHNPASCCATLDECSSFGLDGITNCETGLVCDATGTCVSPQCGSDGDCPSGDECANQLCIMSPPASPVCGNGIIEAGEVCDDGNTADGDGCSSDCQVAHCFVPVTHPTIAAAVADPSCQSIDLYSGTYSENVSIANSVSITGVGANPSIIDGGSAASVVTISSGTVTLANLTIQNGAAGQGGGIYNDGLLTLENDIIQSNTANAAGGVGGGIYNGGMFLMLENTKVTGNHAPASGAGIYSALGMLMVNGGSIDNNDITVSADGVYAYGAGIDVEQGQLELSSTVIQSNKIALTGSGEQGKGAGVHVGSSETEPTTISGSMIMGNSVNVSGSGAQVGGGAGLYLEGTGTITFFGTTVSNNTEVVSTSGASATAGATIVFDAGTVMVQDTDVTGNSVTTDASMSPTGVADTTGAGVFLGANTTIEFTQSTISNNVGTATSSAGGTSVGLGGGLVVFSVFTTGTLAATIDQCTISGNQLTAENVDGGGIGIISGVPSTIDIINSTISGNTVQASKQGQGGGLFMQVGSATLNLNSSTVTSNAVVGTMTPDGGGIFIDATGSDAVTAKLANTIDAGNTGTDPDCATTGAAAAVTTSGYNIIGSLTGCPLTTGVGDQVGADPLLGPLADNGGPTFTRALLPGSPAIDKGNPNGCVDPSGAQLTQDQRGQPRVDNGRCDIGAFEK